MTDEEHNGFSERLRIAIGSRPINEIAEEMNMPPRTLRSYLGDVIPKAPVAFDLARILGVNPEWLVLGIGVMRSWEGQTIQIPYIAKVCFSLQQQRWHKYRAKIAEEIGVSSHWVKYEFPDVNLESLRFLYIEGDAMAPSLRNGNLALVSLVEGDSTPPDGIYVMRFSGMLAIRLLQSAPGDRFLLQAENPSYSHYEIESNQVGYGESCGSTLVTIIGRVIYVSRKV